MEHRRCWRLMGTTAEIYVIDKDPAIEFRDSMLPPGYTVELLPGIPNRNLPDFMILQPISVWEERKPWWDFWSWRKRLYEKRGFIQVMKRIKLSTK
jgi:hypothetical protein